MLSFIKLFLMFLLVVVVCVTLKCQLKGGMALFQDPKSLERDKNKCTFNSIIHAFVANRDLNDHVCKVLQERIDKRQRVWGELHKILCTKEYIERITSTEERCLPIDVFKEPLRYILTRMERDGLPQETFFEYNVDDELVLSDPGHGRWTEIKYYELIPYLLDSEYQGPAKSQYSNQVNNYKIERSFSYRSTLQKFFYYAQIDFEAALVHIKGHVVAITRTDPLRGKYTYYDDMKDNVPFRGERGTVLFYYLLKNIDSIEDVTTITKLRQNDRMVNARAYAWTDFFLKLDLKNVEFKYKGNPSRFIDKEQFLYERLAGFMADTYRYYIADNKIIGDKYTIDKLEGMKLEELRDICKYFGVSEADMEYMKETDAINRIIKRVSSYRLPSSRDIMSKIKEIAKIYNFDITNTPDSSQFRARPDPPPRPSLEQIQSSQFHARPDPPPRPGLDHLNIVNVWTPIDGQSMRKVIKHLEEKGNYEEIKQYMRDHSHMPPVDPGNDTFYRIENWNTSSVKNMSDMFDNLQNFNKDISKWDTSSVTDMSSMFSFAVAFNGDISGWNTSSVTNMGAMFMYARSFNQDIKWDTSKVENMRSMFSVAPSFNGDISEWNTSSVTDMSLMFYKALSFNQDISDWNVSSVTNMTGMFEGAISFNQNLGSWNTNKVTRGINMGR